MKNKNNTILSFLLIFLLSNVYAQKQITIGTIDSEPEEKFIKYEHLANYLENKLSIDKIKVNVEIPRDINTAIKLIKEDKLNIFIDSVYPSLIIKNNTDMRIISKRWKENQEGYKSVIFTHKNSNINSIKDLGGKTIAFEDQFSTSAYYIPKKAIEKYGLSVSNENTINNVKYTFSQSEDNALAFVLFGKVDAAATDDNTFNKFDKSLLKIIYKSELVPRHIVSFSKNINNELEEKISTILFNMHKTAYGKKVLKSFSNTKKFSPLSDSDINTIKGY